MIIASLFVLFSTSLAQTDEACDSSVCVESWIGDNYCDIDYCEDCTSFYNGTIFDAGDCEKCSEDCIPSWIGDGDCDRSRCKACDSFNNGTIFDAGDCDPTPPPDSSSTQPPDDSNVMPDPYDDTEIINRESCPSICAANWIGDNYCDIYYCKNCTSFYNGTIFDAGDCETTPPPDSNVMPHPNDDTESNYNGNDCDTGTWKCADGVECITASFFCDGHYDHNNAVWGADCSDGSDEILETCCAENAAAYADVCGTSFSSTSFTLEKSLADSGMVSSITYDHALYNILLYTFAGIGMLSLISLMCTASRECKKPIYEDALEV